MFTPNAATQSSSQTQQRRREFGKYQYFDFENRWVQKVSGDDIEMDLNQIENELIVQLSDGHTQMAPTGVSPTQTNTQRGVPPSAP